MRTPLPTIRESEALLLKKMNAEKDVERHMRLHLLYLLRSEQARTRQEAAAILGKHRHTVGVWLARYQERGLRGLLDIGSAPGAAPPLTQSDLGRLRWKLRQPEGFSSYEEIRRWIAKTLNVELSYEATYYWVRKKLGAAPKVVRPVHQKKNASQAAEFPATVAAEVARRRTEEPRRPIKLWGYDESRFGLKTIRRRRITLSGVKPVMRIEDDFENFWLYGAFSPSDGDNFFLELPRLDGECFQIFLEHFGAYTRQSGQSQTLHLLLVDNAAAHHSKSLVVGKNIALIFLPSYSPELNPAERVWHYLKDRLSGCCFGVLNALSDYLSGVIKSTCQDTIKSLTSFQWCLQAINV